MEMTVIARAVEVIYGEKVIGRSCGRKRNKERQGEFYRDKKTAALT